MRFLHVAFFLAATSATTSASAQYDAPYPPPAPEPPKTTTHTFVEARIGAAGMQPLGTHDGGVLRYGPAFELGAGIGFKWLDVGLAGRYGTVPVNDARISYAAFGPELAVRKSLGDGATLRLGIVPLYAVAWDQNGTHSRIGADALAQLLFTIDNKSRPAWRAGIGLRAGRWASIRADDPGWTAGVDLLVRSWW
jgi:hypothetical protein